MNKAFRALLFAVLIAVSGFLGGMASGRLWPAEVQADASDRIVVQKITIVDQDKRPVMVLSGTTVGGPYIVMESADKKRHVELGLGRNTMGLRVIDDKGQKVIVGGTGADGVYLVRSQATRGILALDAEGGAFLGLNDENNRPRAYFTQEEKDPYLVFYDDKGRERTAVGFINHEGLPGLAVLGESGRVRAQVDDQPNISLFIDDSRAPVWRVP